MLVIIIIILLFTSKSVTFSVKREIKMSRLLGQCIGYSLIYRFHTYNSSRASESVPADTQVADDELYARPLDSRNPKVRAVSKYCCLSSRDGSVSKLCRSGSHQWKTI